MSTNFGVRPYITDEISIYYTENLKTHNLGRISDLLSIRLKNELKFQLELRAALAYTLYFGYHYLPSSKLYPQFSLEIAFKEDDVFCAVMISYEKNSHLNLDSKTKQILEMMNQICAVKSIKNFKEYSLIEIILKVNEKNNVEKYILDIEDVESIEKSDDKSKNYLELGDVDYSQLIVDEKFKNSSKNNKKKIKGDLKEEESITVFKAGEDNDSEKNEKIILENKINELLNKVLKLEKENDQLKEKVAQSKLVKSDGGKRKSSFFSKIFSSSENKENSTEEEIKNDNENQKRLENIKIEGSELENEDSKLIFKASNENKNKEDENLLIFKSENSKENSAYGVSHHDKNIEEKNDKTVFEKKNDDIKKLKSTELYSMLTETNLLKEGSNFKKVLNEMEDVTEDSVEKIKLKRWKEELKKEMAMESAKIQECAKELARQTRQLENEFQAKERMIATELKKKEEQVRQKDAILLSKNETIAQLNVNIEKLKAAHSSSEDQGLKLKVQNAQKLIQMKDGEAKILVQKMKDLENKLMIAQSKSTNSVDPQLNAKLVAAEKRVEEFKRINQRLTETMEKAQEKRSEQEQSESRRKIENLDRQLSESKKNLDKAQLKLKEVQDQDRKNQIEIGKLQEENKKLKQAVNRSTPSNNDPNNNSGTGTPQAA